MIGEIIYTSQDGSYIEVVASEEGAVRCVKCGVGERVLLYRIEYPGSHEVAYTPFKAATKFEARLEHERKIAAAMHHI
jgi:hypothetical protein